MWTIMWTENSQDRWDRLETKEEVMQLLDSLDKNSGVSKGDVWIFPRLQQRFWQNSIMKI